MKARITYVKGIAFLVALAAIAVPTAEASKPEAAQIAAFLSSTVPTAPNGAQSGRAEAKQIAAFLSGTIAAPLSTPAESGRAEAAQIATFLSGTIGLPQPTPAQSGRAEAKQIGSFLSGIIHPTPAIATQIIVVRPSGFDWSDAAIGAGFVGGLALLGWGAALAVRRRRVLTHLPR
jgi:hypothetical protein